MDSSSHPTKASNATDTTTLGQHEHRLMFSHHLPTDRTTDHSVLDAICDDTLSGQFVRRGSFCCLYRPFGLVGLLVGSFLHLLGVRVVSHLFYPWRTLFRICFHLFCNKWPFPCYPFNWGVLLWCCCCVTWVAENLWWLPHGWNWIWVIIIVS